MVAREIVIALSVQVFILLTLLASAHAGPAINRDKKLIGWGVNALSANNLRNHIADLEKDYPDLDGMIIVFWPDSLNSRHWGGRCALFGNRKFTVNDFKQTVSDLKSTNFGRLKENFLYVSTSATADEDVVNFDWFDDKWHVIAENMALYASIAKDVGFNGILLDFEEYHTSAHPLWKYFSHKVFKEYREQKGMPAVGFDEYATRVRKCGREMLEAVTAAYPDVTILMVPDTGWKGHRDYDLLPAFADGILEGAGPEVTLIDGCEDGYSKQTYKDFMDIRQAAKMNGPRLSKLPELYKKRMRYGFGVWLDYEPDKFGGWHTAESDLDKNFRSPNRMEHAVYSALCAADENSYVWMYVWHPDYWWQPSSRCKPSLIHSAQCILCPHPGMPKAYLDALSSVRNPHDLNWVSQVSLTGKQYTAEVLAAMGPNLIENSSFEAWSSGPNVVPDGWTGGSVERVYRIQRESESGQYAVGLEKHNNSHMFLDYELLPTAQYVGKTIVFGVWCKLGRGSDGSISILTEANSAQGIKRWIIEGNGNECPKDNAWHFITAEKNIPDAATRVLLRLNGYSLEPYAPVLFDDAIAVMREVR